MFVIINIGCLCCDTPSEFVGLFNTYEEAEKIFTYLDFSNTSVNREYKILEVPENPMKLSEKYTKRVEKGKSIYEKEMKKLKLPKVSDVKISEWYMIARQKHGKCTDPRIDDEYINNYIPFDILEKLRTNFEWKDDDGYVWGISHVLADQDEKGTFIQLASIAGGCGNYTTKILRIDTGEIEIKNYC